MHKYFYPTFLAFLLIQCNLILVLLIRVSCRSCSLCVCLAVYLPVCPSVTQGASSFQVFSLKRILKRMNGEESIIVGNFCFDSPEIGNLYFRKKLICELVIIKLM